MSTKTQFLVVKGVNDTGVYQMEMALRIPLIELAVEYREADTGHVEIPDAISTYILRLRIPDTAQNIDYTSIYTYLGPTASSGEPENAEWNDIVQKITEELAKLSNTPETFVEGDYINSLNWYIYDF